jgi:HAD superfamily phosphoserine phosphatase-like hydrolase
MLRAPEARVAQGWTVCSDFDGTMTEHLAVEVLDRAVGGRGMSELDELYRNGRVGLAEYTARRFAPYRVSAEELLAIVRERVALRPGVAEAVRLCRARGVGLRVLSGGLDAYLLPLLEPVGVRADGSHLRPDALHGRGHRGRSTAGD